MLIWRIAQRLGLIGAFVIVDLGAFLAAPERIVLMLVGALLSFAPSPVERLRGSMTRPRPSLLKFAGIIGSVVGFFAVGKTTALVIDPGNTVLLRLVIDLEYAIAVYGMTLVADIVDDRPRRKRLMFETLKFPSFKPAFRQPALEPHE